ncbi:Uncharacterized membrane protein YsdA, DUF1294 family [Anaerocolumna jejuensis DSM 15929]|uniref:Uncharacterized membrane protein YsdA, DUF1294 family n=1 Tax=Anaerocolumna jejuensis DSM 15929 TaxID=1121322 RepID=A0A1M6RBC0_9FIRM|nr:DUF1294 domain-containing protein [Anaerocolumna jejuensis]SHK29736.1 Uncharacterized membrane protein YsdA, DUF1294 family [Anaerocolumna jejuensis DSM 15929]
MDYYLLLIYFILVNTFSFLLMGIDKYKARKNKWRIKESTLFLSSVIGGSLGSLLGMFFFRHKTKHKKFLLGMPCILLIHICLLLYWFH